MGLDSIKYLVGVIVIMTQFPCEHCRDEGMTENCTDCKDKSKYRCEHDYQTHRKPGLYRDYLITDCTHCGKIY